MVIHPADKGGGVVVLDKGDYDAEMQRILSDKRTYKKLTKNPTKELKIALQNMVNKAGDILSKKESRYLVPNAPIMPVLYQVPKVQKNAEKPPGRPILSGKNSFFTRLGEYIDVYLQPLVSKSPSYLKNSKDVINHLQQIPVGANSRLVTISVESLYTNIQQKDVIKAVRWAMNKFTNLKYKQKQFTLRGLKLAMMNNFFWYGGQHYNQIKGVSMGAKYAQSIANVFLNK